MSELISIREAARRIGVSDTAVHKAIKGGRVVVADKAENGRPLLAWPECKDAYLANTDPANRRDPGPRGSPRRMKEEGTPLIVEREPITRAPSLHSDDHGGDVLIDSGADYMTAKTAKEIYAARKLRVEWEKEVGKLVEIEKVRRDLFKAARSARDLLMTMEDRLSPILASLTDIQAVRQTLRDDVRMTCDRLAGALESV